MLTLLTNTSVLATTCTRVDPVFAPLIEDLQAETSVPLRLPIGVIEHTGRSPLYSRIRFAEPTRYGISMIDLLWCGGTDTKFCTDGVFFVELASESQESLKGEVIPLAQKITGYFADSICIGFDFNCSHARLIWDQDGYRYYLRIKEGKLETLVKLANSAIENPVLDSFPARPSDSLGIGDRLISKLSDFKPISREYFNFKRGNPIRIANKILSRFRLSLMVSLLGNTGVIATSTAPVDLIFAPLIKDLQAQTSAPLRLPIRVIEHIGGPPLYSKLMFVEPTGYGIRMTRTPHCLLARSCTYGVFFVRLASESKESLKGEVIPLAQKITGYFTDYTCKARCSDARLIWDQDGYRYALGIEAGKLETLVKLANSAIENSVLDLFPDTSRISDCF